MVEAASLRDRALAVLEEVVDPEIPVLTIGDLGILRDVSVQWRHGGGHNHAHLLRLPGDEHDHPGDPNGFGTRRD